MRKIPKTFYEPSDYDNYEHHHKILVAGLFISICLIFATIWLLPVDGENKDYGAMAVFIAVYLIMLYWFALFFTYIESHRKLCKAVAFLQLASMGEQNGIEVRTAHDLVLLIPGMSYDVAERVVKGDYDNLLNHACTCWYIH